MTARPTDDRVRALHDALHTHLTTAALSWLDQSLQEAAAVSAADDRAGALPRWEIRFATAGRHCRLHDPVAPGENGAPAAGELADAARVLLLNAARADTLTLTRLYTRGSADERRAVLLALPYLPDLGPDAVPLVEDALRANDTRLIAAALGRYAAVHLSPHAWRQAVLKCLFTGVPLTAVAGLADRARGDTELARMLADYAAERTAAGRPVPDDLHHALRSCCPAPATPEANTKEP